MRISVIIPTLQAEKHLMRLLAALKNQETLPYEIIIIDSSSSDRTVEIAQKEDCKVKVISQADFNHGKTRNLGMKLATGDIGVFLTQDALPTDPKFLEVLCKPIYNKECAAATACQIPGSDANPIERFSRSFNYPPEGKVVALEDVDRMGVKAYFFSNSASAVDIKLFWQVGGFENDFIVNEDMLLSSKFLYAGYKVSYIANAKVIHSHNYRFLGLFKRYFDIGYFFYQARNHLIGAKTTGEGIKYMFNLFRYLLQNKCILWIPRAFLEVALRFIAFKVGYFGWCLPKYVCKKLSGQSNYWDYASS